MAITDRTRKILWAWSGNQCAMCPQKLIEEATKCDQEAVVGRECHIVSPKEKGPRHDPEFPESAIDELGNLLLLCPTCHAIVDAQDSTYTADGLREIKREHETKIGQHTQANDILPQIRFIRTKEQIPKRLNRLTSGKDLRILLESTDAMYYDHPPILTQEDADWFGRFGEEVQGWEMLLSDNEVRIRVDAELALNNLLNEMLSKGCAVFGAVEKQHMQGGAQGPSEWLVAHITVARIDDPSIVWQDTRKTSDGSNAG